MYPGDATVEISSKEGKSISEVCPRWSTLERRSYLEYIKNKDAKIIEKILDILEKCAMIKEKCLLEGQL